MTRFAGGVHKWFHKLHVLNNIGLHVAQGDEMGFARQVADRVVFMDEGAIMEESPPAEFFERPKHERAQQFLRQVLSPMH